MAGLLEEVALVDHHCHSVWARDLARDEFEQWISESAEPPPPGTSAFDSQLGLAVRRWCAPVLDLAPHSPADEYVARRASLGATDVTRRFLSAARLAKLFVDTGFHAGDLLPLAAVGELAGAQVREVVRLETVAERMVAGGVGPRELVSDFPEALAVAAEDAVAVKSVAAYRGGLAVPADRPADSTVLVAAERWIGGYDGSRPARLDDPLLVRFVLWCGVDAGLPIQFHCGFGDPDLSLHRADPSLLTDFIRAVQGRARIVLLHNYPYHRQAAYLAHSFPHVYADLGLALGYAGTGARAVLSETLEIVPFHKLLYSSDGFGLAELHFLGALQFRRALARVLDEWIEADEISADDAERVARLVGADNAFRLYEAVAQPL